MDVAERVEKAKPAKKEPKAVDPATDPAADETPEPVNEAKPEPDATKPASEVKAAPTDKQVEDEKLTPEEEKILGQMTPKEFRAVFAARGRAERKLSKAEKENEKLTKEVKRIATLEATIAELEKRPTTEANDAKIAATEKELAQRKADLDTLDTDVREREGKVRLREYATDVTKTEDYKKHVTEPRDRMFADLTDLARGAAEDDEGAKKLYNAVIGALSSDDKAIRWRELKKVVSELNPADQSAFRKIYDDWNMILANDKQLNENAEVAKKTVETNNLRQSEVKTKETKARVQKGISAVRPEMEKIVPFLTMDLSGHPEYEKLRAAALKERDSFDLDKATPEDLSALNEMAYGYQLATRVSLDYQAHQKQQLEALQAKFEDQKKELEALKAEKDGKKAEEDKEEEDADEVTPAVGNGNAPRLETFHPGAVHGKPSSFMDAVVAGPGK